MKLTTAKLKQIIKEELNKVMKEEDFRATAGDYPAFYNAINRAFTEGGGDLTKTEAALSTAAARIANQYPSEDYTTLQGFTDKAFATISAMLNKGNPKFRQLGKNIDALKKEFESNLRRDTTEF